jgi:hypothetical protein
MFWLAPNPGMVNMSLEFISVAREVLLNGKAQYSWPPSTKYFTSDPFHIENIIYVFYKTSYLNEEVNCTELFSSVSITWGKFYKTFLSVINGFL